MVMSRTSNYFSSMNKMSTGNKGISTSSLFGTISSILTGGKLANIKSTSESEVRDVSVMLPYGIASFGFKGMKAHALQTGKHISIIGLYDNKRPKTKKGELILYTRDGTQIKFDNEGNIIIKCDNEVKIDGDINIEGNIITNGDINIKGNVSINGGCTVNGKNVSLEGHGHG